jgi:hypothetical protein
LMAVIASDIGGSFPVAFVESDANRGGYTLPPRGTS